MQKIDIAFRKDSEDIYDIDIGDDGDLAACYGFETALQMSLLCERRADASEVPEALRRRGWLGNEVSDVVGFEIGSKIWLYEQARLTNEILSGIKKAAIDCTDWLIEDSLLVNISATIAVKDSVSADLKMALEASNGKVEQRYFSLWELTGR